MTGRVSKVLGGVLGALVAIVLLVTVAARLHDGPLGGPLEIVAAGPFRTGEPHRGAEPDWSFLRDRQTVQLQLLDPERSRTTWILVHDGRPFIASGYMNTFLGRLWKQWPKEAERDGRAILRVDGRLYPRRMVRLEASELAAAVLSELGRKYVGGAEIPVSEVATGSIWLFELAPRP